MPVVVDTSVWIEFLDRLNPLVRDELARLLLRNEVATCGLVVAELRRGARLPAQVREVFDTMEPLAYFEVDKNAWIHAGELAANAAARGYRLEIGDCVLAALALREGCSVYSLDRDFGRIPGLKLHRARTV